MGKVICQNCGAEVIIPHESKVTTGLVIGEDLGGEFIMPTKQNRDDKGRFISNKEDNTMSNTSNTTPNNPSTQEANNMGNTSFTMEQLTQMVAQMVTTSVKNAMTQGVQETPQLHVAPQVTSQTQVNTNKVLTPAETWAMGSQYYGKEICGFVFNPYMWRYHLVKNYKDMYEEYDTNIHKAICDNYDYSYAIRFTIDEIHRMAMLEKRDLISYEERKHTFTLNACKEILMDYYQSLEVYIKTAVSKEVSNHKPGCNVYVKCFGNMGTITEVIVNHKVVKEFTPNDRYVQVMGNITNAISEIKYVHNTWKKDDGFRKLAKAIADIQVSQVVKYHKLPVAFKDSYIRAGAYYTMKAMIAFEGYSFKGESGREGLIALRNCLDEEHEGYIYHAMVKEMRGDLS